MQDKLDQEAGLSRPVMAHENPLEDLLTDALLHRKTPIRKKESDPSLRHALDAASKKMRDLYQLPENWERKRGIAIIDKSTGTLVGNFSEYIHRTVPNTRWLKREHQPIAIDGTEIHEGYLGKEMDFRVRGLSWEREISAELHILLDELMFEAPHVKVSIKTRLGVVTRLDLVEQTQLASPSGNLLILPKDTNIWEACGVDTKAAVRRQVMA